MTREEKERKEKQTKTLVGLILTVLMVGSIVGYAFYQKDGRRAENIDYKGIKFNLKEDGLWHFKIQNQEFSTIYNPKQTENVSGFLIMNIQGYMGKPLYFSYNSNREGVNEMIRNIGRFAARIQYACIDECEENWPVKNCSEDNIIIIKRINETLIKQEENCVYILAKEEDEARACDAFIFKIFGLN